MPDFQFDAELIVCEQEHAFIIHEVKAVTLMPNADLKICEQNLFILLFIRHIGVYFC